MISNRVSTAQIADELLNEFYVKQNHEMLRRKHHRKVEKKLMQHGALSPLQSLHLSQSLENFDQLDNSFSHKLTRSGKRPLSKSVSFEESSLNADRDSFTGNRKVKYVPSSGSMRPSDKFDTSNTDPEVAALMNRVTFQQGSPGKPPQAAKQESTTLSGVGEAEEDNVAIAANSREIQYNAMNESVIMQQILNEILDVHKSVDKAKDDMIVELPPNRQDLVGLVDMANGTYVNLFERMMAELLLIQRSKFKSQTQTIRELRALISELQVKEQGAREHSIGAKNSAEQMEIEMANLHKMIAQLQQQLQDVQLDYAKLEDEHKTAKRKIEALKGGLSTAEKNKFANDIRAEERAKFMKEMALLKKKWAAEMEAKAKEMAKALAKPSGPSIGELAALNSKQGDFKRPKEDATTQTEVDQNGIWDKQDGWVLPISGTRQARLRWRQGINFASCPQCKGVGNFIGMAARLLRMMMRGGGNALVDEEAKPRGKTGAVWIIPDDLVRFMANLPRSAMAISPKPITWTLRRVWHLVDKKSRADDLDESQGLAVQDLHEFLVEAYLIRSEKRSDAELALFVLMQSMQEHHKKHLFVHTYARLVGVLNGWSAEQMKTKQAEKEQREEAKRKKELEAKYKKMSVRERTAHARKVEDERMEKLEREQGKAAEEEKLPMCDASLSLSILNVYHYARSCMLEGYRGLYFRKIAKIKRENAQLEANEAKFKGKDEELKEWPVEVPSHICIDKQYNFYVPLDRALRVLCCMISFADEKQYNSALRLLEQNVVMLLPDGEIRLPEGMHTLVRSTVRELLSTESVDGADMTNLQVYLKQQELGKIPPRDPDLGPMTEAELEESKDVILVNLDIVMRIICECLLYRTRYVEKRLSEIFVEGDDNGDGVLNFSEFMGIVKRVAPHFTDRRTLRMYREALSMGNDDDTIGPIAFVHTCKKHGLVSLVDLKEMKEGSLRALSKTQEQKDREKKNKEIALAAKAAAMMAAPTPLFMTGHKNPTERANARRMSTLQIQSRKGLSAGLLGVSNANAIEAGASPQAGPVVGRRGSVLGGGPSPLGQQLLSSLKGLKASGVGGSPGDGSGTGSPSQGKVSLASKFRRASSVGLGASSPLGGSLSIPAFNKSVSSKSVQDVVPGSEASPEVLSKAEDAALAAASRPSESSLGGTSVTPSATQAPAPMSLSEETSTSKLFGGPLSPALEEEDPMSDSSSEEHDSDSDSENEMQGVITRNEKKPAGPLRVPSVEITSRKVGQLRQLALPEHLSQKREVLLPDDEDEKIKTLSSNTIGAGDVKDVLKRRSEKRLQDRLSCKTVGV